MPQNPGSPSRFSFGGEDGVLARWQGERKKAKETSFLQRCVKKTRNPQGKFTSPKSGMPIDAERFPMFGRSSITQPAELPSWWCYSSPSPQLAAPQPASPWHPQLAIPSWLGSQGAWHSAALGIGARACAPGWPPVVALLPREEQLGGSGPGVSLRMRLGGSAHVAPPGNKLREFGCSVAVNL